MRNCERCGNPFMPVQNTGQAYCRPQCARQAARRRKKDRDQLRNPVKCPNRFKLTYRTWEEAALNTWALDHGLRAYKCQCGAIHYGHPYKRRERAA